MDLYDRFDLFKLFSNASAKYGVIMPIVLSLLYFVGTADLDYGYYTFLRIVSFIFIIILIIAYCSWADSSLAYCTVTLGILLILFNPIIPIELEKETWIVFDIISGILMLSCSIVTFFVFTGLPKNVEKYKNSKLYK